LTQISLPNSITSLGDYCFFNCDNLTKINHPISLIEIGKDVFNGCGKLANKPF
jgi:hypothetical protein